VLTVPSWFVSAGSVASLLLELDVLAVLVESADVSVGSVVLEPPEAETSPPVGGGPARGGPGGGPWGPPSCESAFSMKAESSDFEMEQSLLVSRALNSSSMELALLLDVVEEPLEELALAAWLAF